MMPEGSFQVQKIDHQRDDRHDPLVDGGRGPGGPAPLRRTGDNEAPDPGRTLPASPGARPAFPLALEEGGDRVHGSNGAPGHRQPGQPDRIPAAQEAVPPIGDQPILFARAGGVPGKLQRLIRDHPQFRHDGAGFQRDLREDGADLLRRIVVVDAAMDVEQGDVALDRLRLDDRQPVPPHGAVDVGAGEPAP
jgi:hypothetical protein